MYKILDLISGFEEKLNNTSFSNNSYFVNSENDITAIEVAVPGYLKEDLNISFEENYLVISHKRNENETSKWKKDLEKSFYLSDSLDKEKIKAKLENGILQITIPKKESFKSKITIL